MPFGSTCRRRIRRPREPIVRAARTYPRCFPLITVERTSRVMSGQPNITITRAMITGPPPRKSDRTKSAPRTVGTENQMSAKRDMTVSTLPPKYPAAEPSVSAITIVRLETMSPTSIEVLAP